MALRKGLFPGKEDVSMMAYEKKTITYEKKATMRKGERKTAALERIVIVVVSFCIAAGFWVGRRQMADTVDPFKLLWLWGLLIVTSGLGLQIWRNCKRKETEKKI